MNENIKKTDRDFEVEHTDVENSRYAEEQGSKINDDLAQIKVEKLPEDGTVLADGYTVEHWPGKKQGGLQMMTVDELKEKYGYLEGVDPIKQKSEQLSVYEKLEDVVTDMTEAINIPNTTLKVVYMQERRDKLSRTISAGKYLADGTV
jgi:hypothetical protein